MLVTDERRLRVQLVHPLRLVLPVPPLRETGHDVPPLPHALLLRQQHRLVRADLPNVLQGPLSAPSGREGGPGMNLMVWAASR